MTTETKLALVSFDTDRIKEYVFATSKLVEVRGASTLLDKLNRRTSDEVVAQLLGLPNADSVRVYAAGGSAMYVVPQHKTKDLINTVERQYRMDTTTASITGAWATLDGRPFQEARNEVLLKLRQAKDEKACRLLPGIEPYTQPCAACERYPATCVSARDRAAICDSCHAKRKMFDEYRRRPEGRYAPEDLNTLGEVARPPGYIGFIYADGNSIGERLKQAENTDQYRDFAECLDQLIRHSVDDALTKYPPRSYKEEQVQPYERLLIGGDDLMLVTAGDLALPVAQEITATFEQGSPEVLRSAHLDDNLPLTLGTTVVLAHASFPIAAFHSLAIQLLKRSKQRCAEIKYRESALDFMVVTEAGSSDLSTLREEVLTEQSFVFPHGHRHIRLTQRPYTLSEMQKLIERLQAFKQVNFPRSQLQYLYEGVFHSQTEAIFRWGQVASRVGEPQRGVLERFNDVFGDGDGGLPPWRQADNPPGVDYTSALGDLIEIYQFVPA